MYSQKRQMLLEKLNEAVTIAEDLHRQVNDWGDILETNHQNKLKVQNETGNQNTIFN